jgi:hypothetical protein
MTETSAIDPSRAVTGEPSAVTPFSAFIAGTVESNGQPSTYMFEVGLFNGSATQFGAISSGTIGSEGLNVTVSAPVTGLQPGRVYAYKLVVHSSLGTSEGALSTFTTQGISPAAPLPPPSLMLPIPPFKFPPELKAKVTPKPLSSAQKLSRALKVCTKIPKTKRAACEKQIHKRYRSKTKPKKK